MQTALRTGVLTVLLALGVSSAALAQGQAPGATLESLLTLARERNPELGAIRHEALAAGERVHSAGALPEPRLKLELQDITKAGEHNPTVLPANVGATAYSLTQELPWFGKRELKRDLAKLELDLVQGRARLSWTELAARIKALFVQRYLVQASQRLVQGNLELMLQLEKVMQARYAGGLAAQQDITRIHVEHTAMRAELVALALEWRQTEVRLNTLLGRVAAAPLAPPLALRPLPPPPSQDSLRERLRAANPQLFVASANLKAAEKARELVYKSRYPDFTLGLSAMQRQSSFKEWGLMVELNLPLRDGLLRSQERESEAMLAAAHARQEAAVNQALADLADNLVALQAARDTEHLMNYSLVPQADLTWRAALAGYENGKADFASLLDAQRQIRQAAQNLLKAQVAAQLRWVEIERLIGEDT